MRWKIGKKEIVEANQRLTFRRVLEESTVVVIAWRDFEVYFATGLTLRVASHHLQNTVIVLARLGDV